MNSSFFSEVRALDVANLLLVPKEAYSVQSSSPGYQHKTFKAAIYHRNMSDATYRIKGRGRIKQQSNQHAL